MVKIREAHALSSALPADAEVLMARIPALRNVADSARLRAALQRVIDIYARGDPAAQSARVGAALDILETLAALHLDEPALIAGVLCVPVQEELLVVDALGAEFGAEAAAILNGIERMRALHIEPATEQRRGSFAHRERQGENLRRMLVALIDDPRVALVKLAERVQALRALGAGPAADGALVEAREAMEIYAPLAHRLGVGQIKWELEDLAFRHLHASDYRRIADLLDEKRVDREQFIAAAIERLQKAMCEAGVEADINGRPKHLYSIWRKMQRKGIAISEVYDVRALRVLVRTVADCYTTLGLVHGLWRNLPGEFDDYIANPKPNGYQSLHTTVIGEGGKTLEVQIRTPQMHEEAELGICAHWRYKGGETPRGSGAGYEEKIGWLRQVLGWGGELDTGDLLSEHLRREVGADRVYVLTPDGHVVDLPAGATPVDFAYHVHSELGHRCRGAKVDGHIVTLDYALKTGERVEILRGKTARPNRDWLLADNEFVHTARARSKIRHWFREQNREQLVSAGRLVLERELKHLAMPPPHLPSVAKALGFASADELFAALGSGELGPVQLASALAPRETALPVVEAPRARPKSRSRAAVVVAGVENLLTQFARCCRPLPDDAIGGYITEGRGVSVHRRQCAKFIALAAKTPARVIDVAWQDAQPRSHEVDIRVVAQDRSALLKDIVTLLGNDRIDIVNLDTRVDRARHLATVRLTLSVTSLAVLGRVIEKIGRVSGVVSAERFTE
jgi:GTP pyrophosphokinase